MAEWTIRDDLPSDGVHDTKVRRLSEEQNKRIQEAAARFCQTLDPIMARFPSGQVLEVSLLIKREGGQIVFNPNWLKLSRHVSQSK